MKSAEEALTTAVMSALSSGRPTLSLAIFSFTMATSASATLSITITICHDVPPPAETQYTHSPAAVIVCDELWLTLTAVHRWPL
jgi:hypothetical protein